MIRYEVCLCCTTASDTPFLTQYYSYLSNRNTNEEIFQPWAFRLYPGISRLIWGTGFSFFKCKSCKIGHRIYTYLTVLKGLKLKPLVHPEFEKEIRFSTCQNSKAGNFNQRKISSKEARPTNIGH